MTRAYLALCVLALLAATYLAADAAPPTKQPGQAWEYGVLTSLAASDSKTMWIFAGQPNIDENTNIPDALNIAGKAGWELVAIKSGSADMTTYIFKRPK